MNLYANLVSVDGDEVTYRVGYRTSDITGTVVYNFKTREYRILNDPLNAEHPLNRERALTYLFSNHHSSFVKGIFPERISRVIG